MNHWKMSVVMLVVPVAILFVLLYHIEKEKKFKAITILKKPLDPSLRPATFKQLSTRADNAKKFALSRQLNTSYCFLIDMSLPSGQNRFFVYDFLKDSIRFSGLVTHGRCNEDWMEGRKFSNEIGGGCTSIGKYKIGASYFGRFGKAFKLHGLEKTNNNAFARYVVLHAHECVPEEESTNAICQSDGCPTVSPGFLKKLSADILNSEKDVLLWIYN